MACNAVGENRADLFPFSKTEEICDRTAQNSDTSWPTDMTSSLAKPTKDANSKRETEILAPKAATPVTLATRPISAIFYGRTDFRSFGKDVRRMEQQGLGDFRLTFKVLHSCG